MSKKKVYFVRAEHHKTGKVKQGKIHTNNISHIIATLGKYGWIVNKQYEVHNHKER